MGRKPKTGLRGVELPWTETREPPALFRPERSIEPTPVPEPAETMPGIAEVATVLLALCGALNAATAITMLFVILLLGLVLGFLKGPSISDDRRMNLSASATRSLMPSSIVAAGG